MKSVKLRVLAQVLPFLLVAPGVVLAQTAPTRGEASAAMKARPQAAATQPGATQYSRQQIDQMIAPIALYPDELLAQVLMAATYPEQLVEAANWLNEANHAELKEAALVAALEPLQWDPSVKALLAFPQVIVLMTDHIEWSQALGVAFATQQVQVMTRVQALRQLAVKSGKINKIKQVSVRREGPSIVIVSAQPERVFVPVYNPTVVYGTWPERDFPPVYLPPPRRFAESRGFVVETVEPGFEIIGVPVVRPLWGWTRPDWRRERITINTTEYTRITRTVRPPAANFWRHEGPVVLVAPAARPRPSAPAVAAPAGTVAPVAAAAVVALPQRAHAQPNLIRVQTPAAAEHPSAARPAQTPVTTAQPSPTTTPTPTPSAQTPAAAAQPSTTQPAPTPSAAAKPSTTESAAKPATTSPTQGTAEADKDHRPAAHTGPGKPGETHATTAPASGKPGEPAHTDAGKAKPGGTVAHERQKEAGPKETGQKGPATAPTAKVEPPATAPAADRAKEPGHAGAAGKPAEPVAKAEPAAKAETPAAERAKDHGHAGPGGKPAAPVAKAAPEPADAKPAAASPQPASERVGAGAPPSRAPEHATAKPLTPPAQTGAVVPPGHGGQRPAAAAEPAQGSSAPGKPGAAATPAHRPHEAGKAHPAGQPEAGEKKEN